MFDFRQTHILEYWFWHKDVCPQGCLSPHNGRPHFLAMFDGLCCWVMMVVDGLCCWVMGCSMGYVENPFTIIVAIMVEIQTKICLLSCHKSDSYFSQFGHTFGSGKTHFFESFFWGKRCGENLVFCKLWRRIGIPPSAGERWQKCRSFLKNGWENSENISSDFFPLADDCSKPKHYLF